MLTRMAFAALDSSTALPADLPQCIHSLRMTEYSYHDTVLGLDPKIMIPSFALPPIHKFVGIQVDSETLQSCLQGDQIITKKNHTAANLVSQSVRITANRRSKG